MKFGAIYLDSPWCFDTWDSRPNALPSRAEESHYSTMTDEALFNLDLTPIMAENCALFMWGTWPKWGILSPLMERWGFECKTCAFMWAKTTKKTAHQFIPNIADDANWHQGLGYWTRANTEFCLLGTRGHVKRLNADVRQLVVAPVGAHSAKPRQIHNLIERLVGGPYIELFAREHYGGEWVCAGNELDGCDIQESINRYGAL